MATSRQTIVGKTIVEYLKKYPKSPRRTIARKLVADHPKLFLNLESTRKLVGKYTGSVGSINVEAHGTRREKGVSGGDSWKDLMPVTLHESLVPWRIPLVTKKVLIMSDCHFPYHDEAAIVTAIEHGISEGVDHVLLNGDVMDMYAASQHEKDPRKRDMKAEVEQTRQFLSMLRGAFPSIPITLRAANHEFRLERYLMKYAEILLGFPEFELPSLLGLGALGIEYIQPQTAMYLGKLTVLHGDEYRGSGGVNPARWLSLRTGDNSLVGHFHRTSTHLDRTVRGDTRGWWSTGCLCSLDPTWLRYTQWNLGFAIVNLNQDGSFEVENKTIINGKVR